MRLMFVLLGVGLLASSLSAQTPVSRLTGQPIFNVLTIVNGPERSESVVLAFGATPNVVTAEYRVTYNRDAHPRTGSVEMLIAQGPEKLSTASPALARRTLTWDEVVNLRDVSIIPVESLNLELELIQSQREVLARHVNQWMGGPH